MFPSTCLLKLSVLICVVLYSPSAVTGALVSLKEDAVRVVEVPNAMDPLLEFTELDVTFTITAGDGTSPLPAGTEVSFYINVEYDASLFFPRVSGLYIPDTQRLITITTSDGVVDYPQLIVQIDNDGIFFLTSYKIMLSVESDESSATPTTVVERSSFEVWVYNLEAYPPNFLILNPARIQPKSSKDVYLYAIGGPGIDDGFLSEEGPINFPQDVTGPDGQRLSGDCPLMLPSASDPETPIDQGRYWILPGIPRNRKQCDNRLGQYQLSSIFLEILAYPPLPSAFLNPSSDHLNTGGIQTITVYRKELGSNDLDALLTFGIRQTPLSWTIRWFKDGRFLTKGSPKMTIRTVDQAGLYTIHRYTRKKRSWFVQILVVLSACLRSEINFNGECLPEEVGFPNFCVNGGVAGQVFTVCQCPPCFRGIYCERLAPTGSPFAIAESKDFTCGQLPGGNGKCKGFKFCLGGNYGCSCGCGWHGPDCDRPCRKGFFGADCLQKCNCRGSSCDRFSGKCETSECPVGFHGFNCQLPESVPIGNPMEPLIPIGEPVPM